MGYLSGYSVVRSITSRIELGRKIGCIDITNQCNRIFHIPLAEHIRKESAIFDYPDMCKDTYGRLAEVYGQHVLDNFQLISDSRHLTNETDTYYGEALAVIQPAGTNCIKIKTESPWGCSHTEVSYDANK